MIPNLINDQEVFEENSKFTNLYYMVLMTVNPEYRGRGIATSLVKSCFEVRNDKFATTIVISIDDKMKLRLPS